MIVYRHLSSDEVLGMINNKKYDNKTIYGFNTFHYIDNLSYKHFFVFAQHTKHYCQGEMIGEYIIPDNIIYEKGFGFYKYVDTKRNMKLYYNRMPLPEIIIKEEDFKKDYLHGIYSELNDNLKQKILYPDDNEKYNELKEEYFEIDTDSAFYIDTNYSYSDVYYEMVYQLAKKNDMDLKKVARILKNIDLHNEIKKYFEDKIDFFQEQTKKYVKEIEYQRLELNRKII